MTAVFRASGKVPVKRDVFIICRRSEAKQFKTFLKTFVGKISRQQEEVFNCCMMSSRLLWLII